VPTRVIAIVVTAAAVARLVHASSVTSISWDRHPADLRDTRQTIG